MFDRCEANLGRGDNSGVVSRGDFLWVYKRNKERLGALFIAGTIAVIAGLLFPMSTHIFDVLLVFSVSLTAAVLIIAFSARSALQVLGFPLLIVLSTMLRIALSVGLAKMIFLQCNAGTIISLFGSIIIRNNYVLATLVFGILVVIIFGTIYKAVKCISCTALDFTADIATYSGNGIDSKLNAKVINNNQGFKLRSKITHEAGFFVAMNGVAGFILCAAVIELVIVIVNIVSLMAIGVVTPTSSGMSVKTYADLAVGAGVVTQISALLAAVASGYLVRKSFTTAVASAANDRDTEQAVKRIEVVANEITPSQTAELQYSNPVSYAEPVERFDGELSEVANPLATNVVETGKIVFEVSEWFDDKTVDENEKEDWGLWLGDEIKDSDSYAAIAELIENKPADIAKTILMAAETVDDLGVAVPVNAGIRLAQKGRRCLLIDLDLEREAISKVFDIDSAVLRREATGTPTCIGNLWVFSGSDLGKCDTANIKGIIADLESWYDHLIVYAPNIGLLNNRDRLAGNIRSAMLFGPKRELKSSAIIEFGKLLISYGCDILEPRCISANTF